MDDSTTSASGEHARTHVLLLVHDLDIRIVDAATGELLRELTLDYQPTGKPPGPAPKEAGEPTNLGFTCPGCLETSHGAPAGFEPATHGLGDRRSRCGVFPTSSMELACRVTLGTTICEIG